MSILFKVANRKFSREKQRYFVNEFDPLGGIYEEILMRKMGKHSPYAPGLKNIPDKVLMEWYVNPNEEKLPKSKTDEFEREALREMEKDIKKRSRKTLSDIWKKK